jgi:hypothetical protein
MVEYYSDLKNIFDSLPNSKDNTIVFPHNAMFYPVMKTRNPLSLDWLSANEYIGNEKRIAADLTKIISTKRVYFIIDLIDTRLIANSIQLKDYSDDLVCKIITENCNEINVNSIFFSVYVSR